MKTFLKKYKFIILFVIIAVTALAVAFVNGGDIAPKSNKNATVSNVEANAQYATSAAAQADISEELTAVSSSSGQPTTQDITENSTQSNTEISEIATKFVSETVNIKTSENDSEQQTKALTNIIDNKISKKSKITEKGSKNNSKSENKSSQLPAQKPTASSINNNIKDRYQTDEIPSGKPQPVEPQEQEILDNKLYCTMSISCSTILDNLDKLDEDKLELVPEDGWILKPEKIEFNEGESAFDILKRVCTDKKLHMEYSWTPIYNTAYIEGINNLYEFDCGSGSGWMISVNNWFINYGSSRYAVQNDDVIEWKYTCDLGYDIGGGKLQEGE